MNCHLRLGFLAILVVLSWIVPADPGFGQSGQLGQQPKQRATEAADEYVLRVYQVADMTLPIQDYEYEGERLPTTSTSGRGTGFIGGGGMGGGMMGGTEGGMGGGMGGGMFSVPAESGAPSAPGGSPFGSPGFASSGPPLQPVGSAFDLDSLIQVITTHIVPETWNDVGGPGSISAMGTLLFVRQTPMAHNAIGALLDTIRSEGGRLRSVTVEARWLLLDSDQLRDLHGSDNDSRRKIDRAVLEGLTRDDTSYRGQITCFSGQRVFIVAGRRESILHSGIPVIGSQVGYQAIPVVPNIGVLLQVRPTLLPNDEAAIVDLRSTVTDWRDAESADPNTASSMPRSPSIQQPFRATDPTTSVVPMDHVQIKAQELATTVRIRVGEPFLIGGLTLVPMNSPTAVLNGAESESTAPNRPQGLVKKLTKWSEREQLYLVIEVTPEPE